MALPTHIHFFSFETKVSLELPSDWTLEAEDDGVAIYAAEAAEPVIPRFIVKVIGLPQPVPDAHQALSQAMLSLERPNFVVLSQRPGEVDNQPAVTDVFAYFEPETGQRLLHYQVFAQVEQVIFSLTGTVLEAQAEQLLPVFEAVVESVRFVPA